MRASSADAPSRVRRIDVICRRMPTPTPAVAAATMPAECSGASHVASTSASAPVPTPTSASATEISSCRPRPGSSRRMRFVRSQPAAGAASAPARNETTARTALIVPMRSASA